MPPPNEAFLWPGTVPPLDAATQMLQGTASVPTAWQEITRSIAKMLPTGLADPALFHGAAAALWRAWVALATKPPSATSEAAVQMVALDGLIGEVNAAGQGLATFMPESDEQRRLWKMLRVGITRSAAQLAELSKALRHGKALEAADRIAKKYEAVEAKVTRNQASAAKAPRRLRSTMLWIGLVACALAAAGFHGMLYLQQQQAMTDAILPDAPTGTFGARDPKTGVEVFQARQGHALSEQDLDQLKRRAAAGGQVMSVSMAAGQVMLLPSPGDKR